jgi:hypothetical protein
MYTIQSTNRGFPVPCIKQTFSALRGRPLQTEAWRQGYRSATDLLTAEHDERYLFIYCLRQLFVSPLRLNA